MNHSDCGSCAADAHQPPWACTRAELAGCFLAMRSMMLTVTLQEVRFPPRKMPPTEDHQFLPTHSPLSPLTPTSPLYPDGLIAPIWIRKHTTLVPSVFVLFKRIYETPRPTPNAPPLDAIDPDKEREREAEERRRDSELALEIAQRKKSTNERSIKLTVVLMASRRMLGMIKRIGDASLY